MSNAWSPRRSPRSRASAPLTSGGNSTRGDRGGGGDSHLKPPVLGSACKTETPIRRAPREDIDNSPLPGRAGQFRALGLFPCVRRARVVRDKLASKSAPPFTGAWSEGRLLAPIQPLFLPAVLFAGSQIRCNSCPQSPSPPSSSNGRSLSPGNRDRQAPPYQTSYWRIRYPRKPRPPGKRASLLVSHSLFFFREALRRFGGFCWTPGYSRSAALCSFQGRRFPQQSPPLAGARAHSCPARGSPGPQGKEGAARAPPTTQAEREPAGLPKGLALDKLPGIAVWLQGNPALGTVS